MTDRSIPVTVETACRIWSAPSSGGVSPWVARAFGQLPAAPRATSEIAERCTFRLPLAKRRLADQHTHQLGPGLRFGLEPAREAGEQQLSQLVERALPERFIETG